MMNKGSQHTEHHNNRKMIVFFLKQCVKRKYYLNFKNVLIMLAYIIKIRGKVFQFFQSFDNQLTMPFIIDGFSQDHYVFVRFEF